jgi:uncharacterized protein (TIGR00296 family)
MTPTASSTEPQATINMCLNCFDTLVAALQPASSKALLEPTNFLNDLPVHDLECPLFITWDKRNNHHHGDYELRGCIGSLQPQPLHRAVRNYALASALKDRRFSPISRDELPLLRVGVSLLIRYEPCAHVHDWIVGVHGIMIHFVCDGSEYNATYLPEVAGDRDWDTTTTVNSLIQKSGFVGQITDELLQAIACTRYQSSKIQMTFDEYVKQRPDLSQSLLQEY